MAHDESWKLRFRPIGSSTADGFATATSVLSTVPSYFLAPTPVSELGTRRSDFARAELAFGQHVND